MIDCAHQQWKSHVPIDLWAMGESAQITLLGVQAFLCIHVPL